MRILITGGAGCLGSNLIEHWLPLGHEIAVIDNFATGKREVLPQVERLQVIEGSVADAATVDQVFAQFGPTHVIHSAAAYKDPADWTEDVATNVHGSINVARAVLAHGSPRLINFQTALCYGRTEVTPIPVDHPTAPCTSYGITKTAGEQFLMMSGVRLVSMRLANVTGPRLAIGPVPTFYKRIKAGQKCFCSDTIRDFLDMEDFIAAVDLAMHDDAPTGVYNISSGIGHSIQDVFDEVCDYLGIRPADPVPVVPPGADDVKVVVLDPAHTERMLGWRPQVDFKRTIRRQLSWYDQHGVTDIYSHLSAPKAG